MDRPPSSVAKRSTASVCDYKVVSVASAYGLAEWQLCNLANEPGETRDPSNEMPDVLAKLQAVWDRYAEDVGVILDEDSDSCKRSKEDELVTAITVCCERDKCN